MSSMSAPATPKAIHKIAILDVLPSNLEMWAEALPGCTLYSYHNAPATAAGADVAIQKPADDDAMGHARYQQIITALHATPPYPSKLRCVGSYTEILNGGGKVIQTPRIRIVPLREKEPLLRAPLNWEDLSTKAPAPREWAVDKWLPMGHTALCAGKGGLGKTLLMQTMATCIATGYEYVAPMPAKRRVLFWAGEDEHDELWRRQLAICQWLGVPLAELAGQFILESYFARDITLAELGHAALLRTPMLTELREQVGDYRADYVILDSTARVFGGNENDRHQVTKFISWLAEACQPTGAGLCLIGHPGKNEGSEYSGSTAWEGSVRSRLYLSSKLPDQQRSEDEDEPQDDNRYLSRRKANYAAQDWCKLTYTHGILAPDQVLQQKAHSNVSPEFAQESVLRALRRLTEMQLAPNHSTASPNYLPKLAQQYDLLDGMSPKKFGQRMRELMSSGRLRSAQIGTYGSNRTPRMGLVDQG